jgi:hypothetical protein
MPRPAWKVQRSRSIRIGLVLVSLLVTSAYAQSNAITLPRNLADLVTESPTVVQGWITRVTLEPHDRLKNLLTVVVTVQLEDSLKGKATGTYTFRQAVIDARDQERRLGYRAGQHVLLLLIRPSEYGLASPAGMEQGRFRIEPGPDGKLTAVNGFGNVGLFRELPVGLQQNPALSVEARRMIAQPSPGPVGLDQLKAVIRTIASMKSVP